ncbi:MAG: hypothetical protein V2A78_01340 [bacterium]
MINAEQKKSVGFILLLASIIFVVAFGVYLLTLSGDFSNDSDYLFYGRVVEGGDTPGVREFFHLLWIPLGKAVYGLLQHLGMTVRGIWIMEGISAFFGALSLSFFFLLLVFLVGETAVPFITALLMGFSVNYWFMCVTDKLYPISGLLLVCFFLLLKASRGDARWSLALGAAHGLALLGHATNILFALPVLAGLLAVRRPLREKILNLLAYAFSLVLLLIILGPLLAQNQGLSPWELVRNAAGIMNMARFNAQITGAASGFTRYVFQVVACEEFFQMWLPLLLPALLLIFWKKMKPHAQAVLLCLVWGVFSFFLYLWENANLYVVLFPFWILVGVLLSVVSRSFFRGEAAKIFRWGLMALLVLAGMVIFCLNMVDSFLPLHQGRTDPCIGAVQLYSRDLAPGNVVLTTGFFALYFSYFAKCEVLDIYNEANFYKGQKVADCVSSQVRSFMEQGHKVFLHDNPANFRPVCYYLSDEAKIEVTESECANLRGKPGGRLICFGLKDCLELKKGITKNFELVRIKKYSDQDALFLLQQPAGTHGIEERF